MGHHLDYISSGDRGRYFGDFSSSLRAKTKDKPISGYCDNDAEWFAEIARLFLTNAMLLGLLRPKVFDVLIERWAPVSGDDWESELREIILGVPERITKNLKKKIQSIR
jgi:hypothetical protein